MRLLNVCETAQGGVGTYQTYIAGLETDGVEMHFLAPDQHADILGRNLRVETFDRPRREARSLLNMLRQFQKTRRRLRPDIYFFHSTFSLVALLALRLSGDRSPALYCPHGWAVNGYGETGVKGRIIRGIEGRLSGLANRVVNVSEEEKRIAERLGYRGAMAVIENAVPEPSPEARADLFSDDPQALHLLFVGRLDRQKGFDILLQAFARASRRRSDLRLHVVGGSVRGDSDPADLPPGVHLAGWVGHDRIDDWYRSADALVVPSRWEGLPLVIPEALRNGTPVLCSERSGMEGLVSRGETGDHFPLDAGALEAALVGLDRTALRAMRPACRAAYEARFSVRRLLVEVRALLDALPGESR